MKNTLYNRGTTLIEAVVYLALLAILMSGAVIAAFNLFEANGRAETHILLQEEGGFLLGKIEWALRGAHIVSEPGKNEEGSTLTLKRWGSDDMLSFSHTDSDLLSAVGGTPGVPLNNTNVQLSSILFTHTLSSLLGAQSESIQVSFTLSARTPNGAIISQEFPTTTIFLHQ